MTVATKSTKKVSKPKAKGGSHKSNGKAIAPPKAAKPPGGFKGITAEVYQGKTALTLAQVKELIGWTVVKEGEKFLLKDGIGNHVQLRNNSTNRPFRPGLASRYKSEILRRKWFLNGESIIFDWDGKCQSGQHRFVGFVLACQELEKYKNRWGKYWKSEPVFECLIVRGVNPSQEVIDSIDRGQPRTLGDVFYRQNLFGDGSGSVSLGEVELPALGDKLRQKLSNIASGAARLAWLRVTNKDVSDAPHFPVSEAVDFITLHDGLLEAVAYIYKLEGGDGNTGQKITKAGGTSGISLGYASGLLYLMSVSGTDPEEWAENGVAALDWSMKEKAQEFWRQFASGANLSEDSPVLHARTLVGKIDAGSAIGRDEIVVTIIKAFNLFAEKRKATLKDVKAVRTLNPKTKKEVLRSDDRLGGIDSQGRDNNVVQDVEEDNDTEREGMRVGKNWAEGDTCWVKCVGGDNAPWFGTIREIFQVDGEKEKMAMVEDDQDGTQYEEKVSRLSLKYPG